MNIKLTTNEQIILASLVNSRVQELKKKSPVEEALIELYTNLRNKVLK